ncbi:MAG: rhomboid family intramembrane serine protease, partial [Acidobacteria bacterium]|nr:rhomboid family intramembrane serine protease [Acidobacteriota bacterium]
HLDPRVIAATGYRELSLAPPEDTPRDLLQQELDRRTEAWLTALARNPFYRWGLVPAEPRALSFLSHLLLHDGWLHLGLNLLWLYLCAPYVEDRWRSLPFLVFFLAVGATAGGLYLLRHPDAFVPLIGASGAIAGVVAAFLVLHGRTKMDFVFWLPLFGGTFSAPAWLMIPLWFGLDFWAAVVHGSSFGGGTAYWAHVGGFLAGLAVALVVRGLPASKEAPQPSAHTLHGAALRARRAGDPEDAWRLLLQAVRDNPEDEVSRDTLWNLARQVHRQRQAAPAVLATVRQALRQREPAEALGRWHRLRQAMPDLPADPVLMVQLAAAARRLKRLSEAQELLQSAHSHWRHDMPFVVLEQALRLSKALGSPLHNAFAALALSHPELDPRLRRELEAKVERGAR